MVNTALRQLYQSDEFYKAHTRYLDTTDLPLFDRYFRQVFLPAVIDNPMMAESSQLVNI